MSNILAQPKEADSWGTQHTTAVPSDTTLIGKRSDGVSINFEAGLLFGDIKYLNEKFPFESSLTDEHVYILDAIPSVLEEILHEVSGVAYETSPDGDVYTSRADIAAVKSYADGLSDGDTYYLKITVSTITYTTGFVQIKQY